MDDGSKLTPEKAVMTNTSAPITTFKTEAEAHAAAKAMSIADKEHMFLVEPLHDGYWRVETCELPPSEAECTP